MKYILALALAFVPMTAAASPGDNEWLYIWEDDSNNKVYVLESDFLKGRSNQTSAKAWIKIDHSKNTDTPLRESRMRVDFNCVNWTFRVFSFVSYLPNGESETYEPPYAVKHIIPDTNMDAVAKAVCVDPRENDPRPTA